MSEKEKYQKIYEKIGYKTISTSIHTQKNLDEIKKSLINKVTVFSGHSGVGKSSLVNLIEPGLCLKTNKNLSKFEPDVAKHAKQKLSGAKTMRYQ